MILADQAYNAFSASPEDALVRSAPGDVRKKGRVPKNGSIFFTILQTFMSGPPKDGDPSPYFDEYPPDFFDFIVIDECHRGGANDESNWRAILEYFAPAVQLGLTSAPKRQDIADTYAYVPAIGPVMQTLTSCLSPTSSTLPDSSPLVNGAGRTLISSPPSCT